MAKKAKIHKTKTKKKVNIIYFFSLASLIFGVFLYKNVLPYYFSPQWEVTNSNLNREGAYDKGNEIGEYLGQKVKSFEVPDPVNPPVLGENTSPKRIEVDLTNQKVYAYEGENKVMEFLVSTGKWGRTPTGYFTIQYKNRSQTMKGGNPLLGTYYNLPNVQFVQFFGNDQIPWYRGYSFHGAYWHNNFGHPMSHGCINMRNEDAEKLYYWADPQMGDKRWMKADADNPGTPVIIFGETPTS